MDDGEEDAAEVEAAMVAAVEEANPRPMRLRALVKNVFGKILICTVPVWFPRIAFLFFFFLMSLSQSRQFRTSDGKKCVSEFEQCGD